MSNENLLDCVILSGKDGYFTHCKFRPEDLELHKDCIVGETVNGFKKINFPEGTSYIMNNNVFDKTFTPTPEMIARLEKSVADKEARIKAIQDKYKEENNLN